MRHSLLPALLPTLLTLGLVLLAAIPVGGSDRIVGQTFATRSEVIAPHGMAATSQPLATQIAVDVLKRGGSAVDAAIAANAALGLMEPTGCGIGGDLFAIVWDAEAKKLHGLNASGRSPKSLTLEQLRELGHQTMPSMGALSVSVPGAVDGWFELHRRFAKLPMEELLQPAIDYAENGFPVSEIIAAQWQWGVASRAEYPNVAEVYMPGGSAPHKGELFRNPLLAETLRTLAKQGRDAYYRGEIASTIVEFLRERGGYLTLEDFAEHRSDWVDPVSTNYRGYDVWQLPPNGQGIAVLQLLNLLEGYDLGAMGFGSADYVHTFVEAKKLVYEDRARFYADLDFADVPVEWLISKEYAAKRREEIDSARAARELEAGDPRLEQGDTIYLATADADGNMVSFIQSNYSGLGSGMVPPGLGFMLQNRAALFDLEPGRANTYAPGKRPFHTIIPGFVTKGGEAHMAFGVMGGATQPQGQVQILVNMIDFGMNLQEAGDAPRILHSGSSQPTGERMTDGGLLSLESGFPEETRLELARRGHTLGYEIGRFGGYQAVMRDGETGVYFGASESRKDGQAAGY